jgi:hypothetical protein
MNNNEVKLEGNEMDFYMYESICTSWFGNTTSIRHIIIPKNMSEEDVIKKAEISSKNITGSAKCNINLLQKYYMLIYPQKSYSSLTGIKFHK